MRQHLNNALLYGARVKFDIVSYKTHANLLLLALFLGLLGVVQFSFDHFLVRGS
jgi:hypothetical protein